MTVNMTVGIPMPVQDAAVAIDIRDRLRSTKIPLRAPGFQILGEFEQRMKRFCQLCNFISSRLENIWHVG